MDAARADTADAPAANTQAKLLSKTAKAADMGGKEKRRVVRRDPEKRRLQNIQAQKKYRELFHPPPESSSIACLLQS